MSLTQSVNGKTVQVISINASYDHVTRLAAMGILAGAKMQVVNNSLHEAALVECKGTRWAIGRGLPNQIEVTD